MAYALPNYAREILEKFVREPGVKELSLIPTFSLPSMGYLAFLLTTVGISNYLYLDGKIHLAIALVVNCAVAYGAFAILHDATHRAVSSNKILNDLLGMMAGMFLLPFVSTRVYRFLHLEHHRFAGNKDKDPDEFTVSTPWPFLPLVLSHLEFFWIHWYIKCWNTRPASERVEFVSGIIFYLAWYTLWLTSPYATEFILLWMIPQRIGLLINGYLLAHIQHPEGVLWETHPFQTTAHIKGGKLRSILMLGQDIHQLHHMLPSIPFHRYHAAWVAGKHLFEQQNIPVGGVFWRPKNIQLTENKQAYWLDAIVVSVRDVATDIKEYQLEPVQGSFPSFNAGSHIDVKISTGAEKVYVRQYSLCNSSSETDRYVIAVKKEQSGKGGSRALHQTVKVGDALQISNPRNLFSLSGNAQHYTLVAGGIGMTPIMAMALELNGQGASFDFHICAQNQQNLAFAKQLSQLPFNNKIHIHLDDGEDAQRFMPKNAIGKWREGSELYICGPSGFMKWVESELKQVDWPNQAIFSETFAPAKVEITENTPFEVELARSGKVLTVQPDEFLLDVLNANGCGVLCSCTQGICGSCITPVLSGEPEHRDAVLSDEERAQNSKMCVCVGRAKSSRLVLDL
ncbi:MAG: ferredoxin-NADP reductase/fatty acid desaturase [Colwellia sp.]|jgi:ferredoxin-NADP reductase/fatty acid desaturase